MNILSFEWQNRELKCPARVCPHCYSEEMFFVETSCQWHCEECGYIIDDETMEKFFRTPDYPQFKCPQCGWHIVQYTPYQNATYPWKCPHCYCRFAGKEQEGPNKTQVHKPKKCPTCGENTLLHYTFGYECMHCKMVFDEINNIIVPPRFCRVCEQYAVTEYTVTARHKNDPQIKVFECKMCRQKYNNDMDRLDRNLCVIEDKENINEMFNGSTNNNFSMIIGSQYDNSLK